jgi:hypothetical protein
MTCFAASTDANPLKRHAALCLQPRAPMRSLVAFAALSAAFLLASPAHAQTAGTGTCSGMGLAGTVGLAYWTGKDFQTVAGPQIQTAFGAAECQCPPANGRDQLNLQIKLTSGLMAGTTGTVEVWVGSGCEMATTRLQANQTQCEQIATLDIQNFTNYSGLGANGILVPIDGRKLASPKVNQCPASTTSNQVYVLMFQSTATNFATCTLSLNQQGALPLTVTGVKAEPGDSAVNLSWTRPDANSTYGPQYYQVLCADDCGNPIREHASRQEYSTCIGGVLSRRNLTGNTNIGGTGGGTDGGVVDGGALLTSGGSDSFQISPQADPVPQDCAGPDGTSTAFPAPVPDMSMPVVVDMAGSTDMSTPTATTSTTHPELGAFRDLDPKFLCTGQIAASSNGVRIEGLQNNFRYHFVVVSVDKYGNVNPAGLLDAKPQATDDLYRRYREAGGSPASCFIATAAFGSYESGWVYVLRDFRDQVLLQHGWGQAFVEWYYAHSPPAAAWIADHGWARLLVRALLVPVIAAAYIWVHFTIWQKALLLTLLLALAFRKRLRAALVRKEAA